MNNYTIHQAGLADVTDLVNLFDLYRQYYGKSSDLAGAKHFLTERLQNHESVIFLARAQGDPAGFTQLYPLFSSTRIKKLWLLNDLYVAEAFRGLGISKALLTISKDHAIKTNACGLILETEKTNLIANQLYQTMGWVRDLEHNYYFMAAE